MQEQRAGGSEECASSLTARHPQPVPEPSLMEISSCGSIPTLVPDEGSPLPAHHPTEAAATVQGQKPLPRGGKQKRGTAGALLNPPKAMGAVSPGRGPAVQSGDLQHPQRGNPFQREGDEAVAHRQRARGCDSDPPKQGMQAPHPSRLQQRCPCLGVGLRECTEPRWQSWLSDYTCR